MRKNIPGFVCVALPVLALILMLSGSAPAFEGDLNGDGYIDWADLADFAEQWLIDNCSKNYRCEGADINYSNEVDFSDFALLAQHWLEVDTSVTVLLASYEPSETNLTVTTPDAGLTVTWPVEGGVGGTPTATEDNYVLKMNWTGEIDRKVEIKHQWSGFTYDLAGYDYLLVDVFAPTGSPLFQDTGLIGVWDDIFGWVQADNILTETDVWTTIWMDVSGKSNTNLNHISALVFEDWAANDGTLYIDNLRLHNLSPNYGLTATGHDSRIDLRWQPVSAPALQGYNIYRSDSADGPFTKLNSSPHTVTVYSDFFSSNGQTYFYYITSVISGDEMGVSDIVSATSYAMTDEQLLTSVQEATFRYFLDYGHPVSGLARSGLDNNNDTCDSGGTGMGLMAICVGVERGFVSRAEAAERILKILTFLDEKAERFHGAWSHILNGVTGQAIPFSEYDDGGDIVETSYVAQGMLTVRQYFDDTNDATETAVRSLATNLWEGIDWYWYLRRTDTGYEDNETLFWHWSPNYGWAMNHNVLGYDECMITYLMAIASPTHPIPASCYYHGWASKPDYANGRTIYGYTLPVGSNYSGYGGPMFFAHYTYLGFDPNWSDAYCNYSYNNRQIALSDRAYCAANPGGYTGYSDLVWGLTASCNPYQGYRAHCPVEEDDGTIAPTAAISSIIYTPDESIATLKHFYHTYGAAGLWGPFGFVDAFNLNYPDWYANNYITIDQGPIVVMIENYRSGLCWDLFMANSEVTAMMAAIAATEPTPVTFDDFDGNNINDGWFGSGGTASWTIDTSNTEQVHSGSYALKAVYNKGTEPWAYLYAPPSAGSRDFSDNIMLKFWIYSSKSANYIFRVEYPALERNISVTANTWQEVTLTLGADANDMTNISKVLVFPEAGISGGSGTFWLDDITLK